MRDISDTKSWFLEKINKIETVFRDRDMVHGRGAKGTEVTVGRSGGKSGDIVLQSQEDKEGVVSWVKCDCWIFQHGSNW